MKKRKNRESVGDTRETSAKRAAVQGKVLEGIEKVKDDVHKLKYAARAYWGKHLSK